MPVIVKVGSDEIEKQVIPCGVSQDVPVFPIANGSIILPFQVDLNGAQFVHPTGGQLPADALPTPINSEDSTSYTMVWNGVSWDRVKSIPDNADNQNPAITGLIGTVSRLEGWEPVAQFWHRLAIVSDNANTQASSPVGLLGTVSRLEAWNGGAGQWARLEARPDNTDALAASGTSALKVIAEKYAYNGSTWDRERTPNVFKTVTATAAGSTALWTPAAGKKFRVMKVHMSITSNAAAAVAAVLLSRLLDGVTFFGISDNNYIPLAGVIQQHQNFIFDLGNGYLSAAANNVLNIDLSFALTAGVLDVTVAGTEE